MIRDALRAVLAVAVLAAAAGIVVEARRELAVIDLAQRFAGQPMAGQPMAGQPMAGQPMAGQPMPPEPTRLRRLGRAALDMADAALNVVR